MLDTPLPRSSLMSLQFGACPQFGEQFDTDSFHLSGHMSVAKFDIHFSTSAEVGSVSNHSNYFHLA